MDVKNDVKHHHKKGLINGMDHRIFETFLSRVQNQFNMEIKS